MDPFDKICIALLINVTASAWHKILRCIGLVTESQDTRLHSSHTVATEQSGLAYTVWSVMQEKVYQHRIKDVGELHKCIVSAWDKLGQRVIDTAVKQWQSSRLRQSEATLNTACRN